MDNRWPKWIIASICKFIEEANTGYPYYLEGQPRTNTQAANVWFEVRHDVEYYKRALTEYDCRVELNLLVEITSINKDVYLPQKIIGSLMTACFTSPIPLLTIGENTVVQFGCLKFRHDVPNPVRSYTVGQPSLGVKTQQIVIEAFYQSELT